MSSLKSLEGLKIRLAEGQNFGCTACGRCCTSDWKVKVSQDMASRLQETESYHRLVKAGYHPLPLVEDRYEINRHENGVCYFHQQDGCDIHRELGGSKKPVTCQVYPFHFVETPDGIFVSLSYSCPAVLAGLGEPLSHMREELTELIGGFPREAPQGPAAERHIRITGDHEVSWPEYLRLEEMLLNNLQAKDPVLFLLNAAASMVATQSRSGRLNLEELELSKPIPLLREAFTALPLFAGACVALIEKDKSVEEREAFREALLSGLEVYSDLLNCPLPRFEILQPDSLMVESIIDRYLRNLLFGKRLLLGKSVVSRLLLLASGVAVLLYYYKVRSQEKTPHHFNFEHLDWAFEMVEVNIVTHTHDLDPCFVEFERMLVSMGKVTPENNK